MTDTDTNEGTQGMDGGKAKPRHNKRKSELSKKASA